MAYDSGNQSASFGSSVNQQTDRNRNRNQSSDRSKELFVAPSVADPSRQNQPVFNGSNEFPHEGCAASNRAFERTDD